MSGTTRHSAPAPVVKGFGSAAATRIGAASASEAKAQQTSRYLRRITKLAARTRTSAPATKRLSEVEAYAAVSCGRAVGPLTWLA